jgi:ATP-binding cassette, subfamily B, bacterial MsbA
MGKQGKKKKLRDLNRTVFARLMGYFKPYFGWILLALLFAFIVGGSAGATAYLIEPVMSKIFTAEPLDSPGTLMLQNEKMQKFLGAPPPEFEKKDELTPEQRAELLAKQWEERILYVSLIPLLLIGLFLVKNLFRFLQNYILRIIGERVIRLIRHQLYDRYQSLSVDYYTEGSTGIMMSRITNDVNMMQRAVPSLVSLFREPVAFIGLAVVAFYQIWYLALIILVIFPITVFPIAYFGKKIRKYTKRGQEHMGDLNSVLKENFSGIRVIKAFNMEEYELARFDRENERVYKAIKKRIVFDELSSPSIESLGSVAAALALFFGGWLVLKTMTFGGHYLPWFGGITLELTTGQFFSFMASLGLMYEPLKKINKMNINFQSALGASERVFEVLDTEPTVVDQPGARELTPIRNGVRFENVRFRYDTEWICDGIDFEAKAGQSIALVGSSGAGKTTLVGLIPRFYDVVEGAIKIDNHDIRGVSTNSLRAQIGIVTQETFLFADTVAHNIAYGQHEADREKIIAAAKAAYAHEFVTEMSEGYDTLVGELGLKLSGGQRQRLAIARALYKNAPILILDEATSALDTESERKVQAALENLMRGRTTFVIAHRLSTVRNVDRILVLNRGRIVEDGTHDALLEKAGEYARLYQMQFSDQDG